MEEREGPAGYGELGGVGCAEVGSCEGVEGRYGGLLWGWTSGGTGGGGGGGEVLAEGCKDLGLLADSMVLFTGRNGLGVLWDKKTGENGPRV